jgi:hypothetical protein
MARLGVNPHTINFVLGNANNARRTVTEAVYIKYTYDREKREAMEQWCAHIETIVSDRTPMARQASPTAQQ